MATESGAQIIIPEGYTLHTENSARILLPPDNQAFLNPVQEFNRDMSVACIRTWTELLNEEKRVKWGHNQERRARKAENGRGPKAKKAKTGSDCTTSVTAEGETADTMGEELTAPAPEGAKSALSELTAGSSTKKQPEYQPYKSVILEALSATGLRSIRYAKEIPLVRYVTANDNSPAAVEAMTRNVEINGLAGHETTGDTTGHATNKPMPAKVRVSEADACALMYNHRAEKDRVDVVDLDPYGTAAPFIDAAVQCVQDGGLLCVTCTDLSVLASTNYPEKCFSNYGGVSVKAEYCHEAALRLLLHALSTSAARYSRYVQPLVSLSIDFYVRVFVRVHHQPNEVKKALSKTSLYYICSGCQSFYDQPLGRMFETVHEKSGNVNRHFKLHKGPTVSETCPECNSTLHVAGPMWSGPIHDATFIGKVLEHVTASEERYGTSIRMKGMLTVAQEELATPFYFTPSTIAGKFHCIAPSLDEVASALLHAGHQVSRSHACPGSLKTTASRADVHDIFRSWIKTKHPVKMEKVSETSPTHHLLSKEAKTVANFQHHPQSITSSAKVKVVRYQTNPTPYWGPGTRAGGPGKRKREGDDE